MANRLKFHIFTSIFVIYHQMEVNIFSSLCVTQVCVFVCKLTKNIMQTTGRIWIKLWQSTRTAGYDIIFKSKLTHGEAVKVDEAAATSNLKPESLNWAQEVQEFVIFNLTWTVEVELTAI